MNLNQIVNMVIRLVMRKAINGGINAGMKGVSRLGKGKAADGSPATSADASQKAQARDTAKRARQAAKVTRKLGR